MGLLFTTEGTRRIINTLNTAFDGPTPSHKPLIGLDAIRSLAGLYPDYVTPFPDNLTDFGKTIRDRAWAQGELAGQLDLLPFDQGNASEGHQGTDGATSARDTRRWNLFLTTLAQDVFKSLKNALAGAILNRDDKNALLTYKIVRVSFDHVELTDSSAPSKLVIFDAFMTSDATGPTVRHMTLFTPPVAPGQQGNDFDGPIISGKPWQRRRAT